MPFPRPAKPKVFIEDLRAFIADRSRHQIIAAVVAIMMPMIFVFGFIIDANTNTLPGEQVIYVESWSANRTDAEIKADQKKRQAEKEALQKERQRQFKKLDDSLERMGI
jgi:hypothetical protein